MPACRDASRRGKALLIRARSPCWLLILTPHPSPPHTQLHGEAMTAIPSRNVAHPSLPVLAAATNSGRVHIYR